MDFLHEKGVQGVHDVKRTSFGNDDVSMKKKWIDKNFKN